MRSYATTWQLRRAKPTDVDRLHALTVKPLVYRYLFDGVAPARAYIATRLAQAAAPPRASGFGMWLLEDAFCSCVGCVELRPHSLPSAAELTYLLDPDYWGQGLATRMAWTAISRAFQSSQIDIVVAGADIPNAASMTLMQRLGMHFHKEVLYPLGAGLEYILHREDAGPTPRPPLIPIE